jgi:hypothetical protein
MFTTHVVVKLPEAYVVPVAVTAGRQPMNGKMTLNGWTTMPLANPLCSAVSFHENWSCRDVVLGLAAPLKLLGRAKMVSEPPTKFGPCTTKLVEPVEPVLPRLSVAEKLMKWVPLFSGVGAVNDQFVHPVPHDVPSVAG